MTVKERRIETRWIGDEYSEGALLRLLGKDLEGVAPGECERWMAVPARQYTTALRVLREWGARMVETKPCIYCGDPPDFQVELEVSGEVVAYICDDCFDSRGSDPVFEGCILTPVWE